ncbi:hypothetical protein PV665_11670 [Streptomyces sp. ID05-18]|nr:hypothetical protein [Streptomyces sp. ID05-18]
MNVRVIGLMAAAVFAGLVPLVASADPVVAPDAVSGDPAEAKSSGGSPESVRTKTFDDLSGEGSAALSPTLLKSPSGMSAEAGSLSEFDRSPSFEGDDLRRGRGGGGGGRRPEVMVRCGPELVAPEGVEAQTCVLTQGGGVWARAYYRNATGEELRPVLSLMGPGGRTVELHCASATDDEPGTCETPRVPSPAVPRSATAVAEFVGAGPVDEAPLLLRAGSERAPDARD